MKFPELGLWFWRRAMAWAIVIAAHAGAGAIIWLVRDPDALKWVGLALVVEAALAYTLYFCGATAQHLVEIAGKIAPSVSVGLSGISVGPTPAKPAKPGQVIDGD